MTRLPPGQVETRKFPVLHVGGVPLIDISRWRLRVTGMVERGLILTHEEVLALPAVDSVSDFHCVTRWSRLDNAWRGVHWRELAGRCRPVSGARFATIECAGDYATSISVEDLERDDVLFAYEWEGQPLTPAHGWPLRLVIPHLYAYKCAKWVTAVRLTADKELGYWESRGYSDSADPRKEERLA